MTLTFADWNDSISVPDYWFRSLPKEDRTAIERRCGISWEDLSSVGKKMIYQKEVKFESINKSEI